MSLNTSTLNFPKPTLSPIEGTPTFLGLRQLKAELIGNALSVPSTRGTGTLGYVALVIGKNAYDAKANPTGGNRFNWTDPTHPGTEPKFPAKKDGYTDKEITTIKTRWEYALKEFEQATQVATALKQQLIAAVPDKYLSPLADPEFGYAMLTVFELFQYLMDTYGKIAPTDLTANLVSLTQPWTPEDTMISMWKLYKDAQALATAGNEPIPDTVLVRTAHKVLTECKVFEFELRDWDKLPEADKTFKRFETFFTEANTKRVQLLASTDGFPRHSAFLASEKKQDTTNTSDKSKTSAAKNIQSDTSSAKDPKLSYCWTHGILSNPGHTSLTCTNKAHGHKEDATLHNMLGGNNVARRKFGEKNDYRKLNPLKFQPRNSTTTVSETSNTE